MDRRVESTLSLSGDRSVREQGNKAERKKQQLQGRETEKLWNKGQEIGRHTGGDREIVTCEGEYTKTRSQLSEVYRLGRWRVNHQSPSWIDKDDKYRLDYL